MTEWTKENRRAVFHAFTEGGMSYTQIAGEWKTSRQAIAGIVHRWRQKHGLVPPRKSRAKGAPRTPPGRQNGARRAAGKAHQRTTHSRPLRPIAEVVADARAVPLADLGPRECLFAVSPHEAPPAGHLFCGLPAAGTYCPEHSAIVTAQ